MTSRLAILVALAALAAPALRADEVRPLPTHGISLEGVPSPHPVRYLSLEMQRQALDMAYLDLRPDRPSGSVVVLLHGKNFSGLSWVRTGEELAARGHRVIIPDQIGFGRSSKPACFHFSFPQLALATHELLRHLGVDRARIVGHSMGGMLAVRYALTYPDSTEQLVLVNPIGLEDWQALGVPPASVDELHAAELGRTRESIRKYQLESYYHGEWRPEYDRWLDRLAGMLSSPEYRTVAWIQALTSEMIFAQPVVHELPRLEVPTLLVIGQLDRTAIGKERASAGVRAALGDYPSLGRAAARAIPGARLVELDGVGHVPHVEAFDRFLPPLADFLDGGADMPPAGRR